VSAAARSVEGRPLRADAFGPAAQRARALVFGGIHGDEPGAVAAVERLAAWLAGAPPEAAGARIVVAPVVNPTASPRARRTTRAASTSTATSPPPTGAPPSRFDGHADFH